MDYNIYYFTGTGNSLFIAKTLADLTESSCKSIASVMNNKESEAFGSHIMIVFPSYLAMINGMPVIVKEFVESIPDLESKKIIVVCSCGGYEKVNAVPSTMYLSKIIKAQGGRVFDYFTLRLPMNNLDYNHIPLPIEKNTQVIIEKAEKKIIEIAKKIKSDKVSYIKKMTDIVGQTLLKPMYIVLKKTTLKLMLEIAQEPRYSQKSIEEIFRYTDRSISVDENCNGCGLCAKVCPVGNIEMVGNLPVFTHHCEMCFACHEWCPQKAIHHWGRKDGIYYHHPNTTVTDFIIRK